MRWKNRFVVPAGLLAAAAGVAVGATTKLGTGLQGLKGGFGGVVTIHGDTLAIASSFEAFPSSGHHGYVYVKNPAGDWVEQAALDPSGNIYAYSSPLALRGDTVAIGSVRAIGSALIGSVETFSRTGTTWSAGTALAVTGGTAGDGLGETVGFSADASTLFAGAPGAGSGPPYLPGAVYVFVETVLGWQQTDTLVPADGQAFDQFGSSIASSGDTLVVGSKAGSNGAAYVYQLAGAPATWTPMHRFANEGWRAAVGVDAAGTTYTIVLGDPDDATNGESSGAVRVYTGSGAAWTLQQTLFATAPEAHDRFGTSVAIDADTIVVGAEHEFSSATRDGETFVFKRTAGVWAAPDRLESPEAAGRVGFGRSVDVDGINVLVGAGNDDAPNTPGSVFLFDGAPGGGGGGAVFFPFRVSQNPAVAGGTLTFDVLATPAIPAAKPAPLVYHWDFGDGTTLDAGSRVTHTFAAPGNFDVVAETTIAGTGAVESQKFPVTIVGAGTPYFDVAKVSVKLNFKKDGKDAIQVAGQVPVPDGTSLAGLELDVKFGGIHFEIDLDARGKGKSGNASAKVSAPKGGVAKFTLKAKGAFASQLADEGMTNAAVANGDATTEVEVQLLLAVHTETLPLVYTGKPGKSGSAQ